MLRSERRDGVIIWFRGDLCADTTPWALDELEEVLERRPSRLAIDLAGVGVLSAAGVSLLVRAQREAQAFGGRVHLCAPRSTVRRVLELCGLGPLLADGCPTDILGPPFDSASPHSDNTPPGLQVS